MYSALKVNGKKLYEYAREGIEIERKERDIEIYNIDILKFDYDDNCIEFEVFCSKGTYIRTLCENIAEKIGTVGYMKNLIRLQVDEFKIEDSVTLYELEHIEDKEKYLISIESLFNKRGKIELDSEKCRLFINGGRIKTSNVNDLYRIYCEDKFIGLGKVDDKILKREIII